MFLRRMRYWLSSARRDEALREEMELHLSEKTAQLEADGIEAGRARAEALRHFGNVGLKREESREIWLTRFWSELCQDVRYGSRALLSNKTFSVLAVLLLALGIGANTAIYSWMESILLRSLPVAEPDSLVVLNWHSPPPQNANREWVHVMHGLQGLAWPGEKGVMFGGIFPYPAFETLHDDNRVFTTLFAYCNGLHRTLSLNGHASSVGAEFVTGEYFHGLSVFPAAGRLISSADDHPNATPVAVLSYAISESRFGGPAGAIGQSVLVDNVPFTVIGVAPPEFFGVDPASVPGIYLPLHTNLLLDGAVAAKLYNDPNFYWIEMMGRLRPGVSMAMAQAELAPRFHQWVAATASTDGERAKLPALTLDPGAAGLGSLRRRYSKPLYLLLLMAALILAIACANIANLLLARAASRRSEMAIRLSLGAGRLRVIRQLLTESVLLASLGGIFGVLFAIWGMRSLAFLFASPRSEISAHASLNWHVLFLSVALSVLCGLLFGLVPALQATRPDVAPTLKNARWGAPRRNAQHVLVIVQIAISFVMLVAAGLFVGTLNKLHSVSLGYTRENILLFSLNARQAGHRDPEIAAFYENLRQRLASIPGVRSATLSQSSIIHADQAGATYRGAMKIGSITIAGAGVLVTGPNFLATMQIPLLAGRAIDEHDRSTSAPVAIISERLARTYFKNENPIGRRITFVDDHRDLEIVGISANLRYGGLKEDSPMTVLIAASQFPPEGMTYALRTAGDPLRYVRAVEEIVRQSDSRIPVTDVITQAAEIDQTISHETMFAKLCTTFAVLALLIACVGLYGTMSYNVARQIREIGIRIALGAERSSVIWMVLGRVLFLTAAGLCLSVPAALIGSRLVRSFLFETRPNDPRILALAAAVLLAAAILAGFAPARRASRIDPLAALRHE